MDNKTAEDTLPPEIIIRKSKLKFILHSTIAIWGFALVIYISFTEKLGFSLLPILFVIIFGGYTLFALRGLSDRSIKITMDRQSISFKDGTALKWNEIKHVSLERKKFAERVQLGKGPVTDINRYYLKIETSFSGQITGYRTAKSVEITSLEYTPGQILHFIEQYKRKYRS